MSIEIDARLEDVACDLCGQRREEFLYTKPGCLTGYPFRVVRCRACGFIYLNPRLTESALAELYDRAYYAGQGFDPHVNYLEDLQQDHDSDKLFHPGRTVELLMELVPAPARLLDFGCGLGDLMQQATKHGYAPDGFEVSAFAADFVRAQGFRVYTDLDQLPTECFDVVTAVEVLEHCYSPTKALAAIHRALKPGGVFYYTTANFDGFYQTWRKGTLPPLDGYIAPEGHIHFFSTQVMRAYFKKIGFSRIFQFESPYYNRQRRYYRTLHKLRLMSGSTGKPETALERVFLYGGRKVASRLGLRTAPLPLARK